MSKSVGRTIGRWAGAGMSAALAGAGVVALRHALETPQPLKSVLPGEAHLYRWKRRSIFYKVSGDLDAPPLLLLHTPDIGASGYEMVHIMSPLARTFRVYTPDLLGFGLSDHPNLEYSAELYHTLCQDFLREVVQKPATLVASGLSCNYAVAVAANAPDLCTSLVLISPFALQGEPQPFLLQQWVEKPLIKALLYPLLSTRSAFLLMSRCRQEGGRDFSQFYANTHQLGAEHAAMAFLAGKLTDNMEQQLATLRQPVLLIWGRHALDEQPILISQRPPNGPADTTRPTRKVELIQEAGLAVHQEQPESVSAAIRDWWEEIVQATLPIPEETPLLPIPEETPQIALPASEETPPLAPQADTSPSKAAEPPAAPEYAQPGATSTPATAQVDTGEEAGEERNLQQPAQPPETSAPAKRGKTETVTPGGNEKIEAEVIAYCVKCKQKRKMLQAHKFIMKNGRPAIRGVCPVCGTHLNRIGGLG